MFLFLAEKDICKYTFVLLKYYKFQYIRCLGLLFTLFLGNN